MASRLFIQSLVTANPNIAIGCPSPTRADAIAPIASVVPVTAMMMAVVTAMMMAVVTAMMMAVVTAILMMAVVTAMCGRGDRHDDGRGDHHDVAVVTAMKTMTMTAMTAMTMTGERRHGKQHGSRYRANKRELPKHEFLRGSARDPYPDENVTGAGSVPLTSDNETLPSTMDR